MKSKQSSENLGESSQVGTGVHQNVKVAWCIKCDATEIKGRHVSEMSTEVLKKFKL